jgi:hypothetical protein
LLLFPFVFGVLVLVLVLVVAAAVVVVVLAASAVVHVVPAVPDVLDNITCVSLLGSGGCCSLCVCVPV